MRGFVWINWKYEYRHTLSGSTRTGTIVPGFHGAVLWCSLPKNLLTSCIWKSLKVDLIFLIRFEIIFQIKRIVIRLITTYNIEVFEVIYTLISLNIYICVPVSAYRINFAYRNSSGAVKRLSTANSNWPKNSNKNNEQCEI